uniref:Uncharacterized protein n=1 Tax=Florenciella sp. virus SA2 TaxID=3240092 RepID=A0AB39JB86_9VIRU
MSIKFYYALCIIVRLFLATLTYFLYNSIYRLIFVVFYFLASIGTMYLYFTKSRKTGAFNQNIWWDFIRPIHSTMFFAIAFSLYNKFKYTYIIVIIDTLIGIPFHIKNRYL